MRSLSVIMFIALNLILMIVFASACDDAEESEESETVGPVKVFIIYPSEKGDHSITDAAAKGMADAEQDYTFEKEEFSTTTGAEGAQETFDGRLANSTDDKMLIITVGGTLVSLYDGLNCDFGGRYVLQLDSAGPDCPNAKGVIYATYAPSFLAGVAAMQVSQSKKAAAIGGMDIDPVNEFILGFEAGVEYAGGEYVETRYVAEDASGFGNPEEARSIAEDLYDQVDVVFPVAGGSNLGVFEAAQGEANRYVIGTDVDQSSLGPEIVIASVVKRVDISVYDGIADVNENQFESGEFRVGLNEDMTGLVVNEAFKSQVDEAVQQAGEAAIAAEEQYNK